MQVAAARGCVRGGGAGNIIFGEDPHQCFKKLHLNMIRMFVILVESGYYRFHI